MTPEQFAVQAPIHPESLDDYRTWETLLRKWNARINLVAPKSLPEFWQRHALDSAQILPLIPETVHTICDFGSGAGFPGLAIAIQAKHKGLDQTVHLIESAGKKASFLKTVSRETKIPTVIHGDRIEALPALSADVITARAFAPLHRLLPLAWQHLTQEGQIILLKGGAVDTELSEARRAWTFDAHQTPSLSDETGCLLTITGLAPK
ncbi:MAG: 16S rRNA (guanine(527)-N(7))-methyltransferase RsmG [Litorimonas sp.]